jgi:hypothetical protein
VPNTTNTASHIWKGKFEFLRCLKLPNLFWLFSMKKLMTNKQFLILLLSLGGAVGFFNAFLTFLQQMMCSRGYENWFSGVDLK